MAVIENGVFVEKGRVRDVFTNPNSNTGQIFIKVHSSMQNKDFYERGEGI